MDDSKVVISEFGPKYIDNIGEIANSDYSQNEQVRAALANKCADFLQLKNLPDQFKDYCVKMSDIPNLYAPTYENPNVQRSADERSLLGMGLVYRHGHYASFIDRDGHTYLLPANNVLLQELENSGYVMADYGAGTVTKVADPEYDPSKRVIDEGARGKVTLPDSLVEEVINSDPCRIDYAGVQPYYQMFRNRETGREHDNDVPAKQWRWMRGQEELSYDVFSLYKSPENVPMYDAARNYLGADNFIAQKLSAVHNFPKEMQGVYDFQGLVTATTVQQDNNNMHM